ncbi:hypothetical protein [uncultured Salinibacterium sp.]|uniref:hypothetical protein n=1 Tax=uncultured Salinibacterium sp. TaxID=459274 RepID=UPI0030D8693D
MSGSFGIGICGCHSERLTCIEGIPTALCGKELPQGFLDFVTDDIVLGNVQVAEYRLVQFTAHFVGRVHVEVAWIAEQLEERLDVRLADL